MSEYEKFIKEAKEKGLKFDIAHEGASKLLAGDVLFHTPLLSLAILVIANSFKNQFTASEVSNWTGSVLAQTFWGPKQANRKLEWSLTLRKRCADALIFLESMDLISVYGDSRAISVTEKGKDFCRKGMKREDDYGQLVRGIRRSAIDVDLKGFTLL